MNELETLPIPKVVEDAWASGMTYTEYREEVARLLKEGQSTGNQQSDAFLEYSRMGHVRMNRLDKTLKITSEQEERLSRLQMEVNWLVMSEGWCGDAGQTLPVMALIERVQPLIKLRIVIRDAFPELMDAYLTHGTRSIPKLIQWDAQKGVTGLWGPRPLPAVQMVEDYKSRHGKLTAEFRNDLQLWYSRDKGYHTAEELVDLLPLELIGDGSGLIGS